MLDLRLVAYAPNGARLGLVPYPLQLDTGWPLNDVPALRLTYSAEAARAEWLATPCELAVEWSDGGDWTEEPDSRFILIKRRGDVSDKTGARSYDLPGWAWQLRKLILYPGGTMADGKRQFSAVTVGAMLRTMVVEGQARGALPGLAVDFDTTHDSAGQPWANVLTIGLEIGNTNLHALLINLAEQGTIDWQMQGRTLRVFNEGTALARDLATGAAPVDLRLGRDVTEAPDEGTWEQASSHILIGGEAGLSVEVSAPVALPWGRWETYQSQSGVKDAATAAYLGQNLLQRASGERVQITRGITLGAARWLPWRDYRPGDTILAPGDGGTMAPLRVRQITLTRDQNGTVAGNLVLNDRFLERDIRLARRAAGILDGGVATGGTGGTPTPDSTGRVPAAPAGLIVAADAYLGADGWARGLATATWSPVTEDVNGVAIDISGYELHGRRTSTSEDSSLLTATSGNVTTVTHSPLQTREEYAFKVRALAGGTPGEFSDEFTVMIPDDVTPPPVPSAPTLSTRMGQIYVTWDGLGEGGAPMPADFEHINVWMSPDELTWETVGTLRGAGALIVGDQPYGQDRTFRLTSVDRSDNESDPSGTATIATVPAVDTDLIEAEINGANIVDGTIVASDKVTANSITGGLIKALAIETGHLKANAVTTDKLVAGAVTAAILSGDAIDGKTITGAYIRTASSGRRLEMAPPGATVPELRFYPNSGSNYTVIRSRDDVYSGEALLEITTSQNASSSYRARLQMGATRTVLEQLNAAATASRGGYLDISTDYAKYGYYAGSTNSECYIEFNSSGRWVVRGRYWDLADADPHDAVLAGSFSVGSGSLWAKYSYGPTLDPVTMATSMAPVATVRDGRAGGPTNFGNTFVAHPWVITASDTTAFQINMDAEASFAVYFWAARVG